MISQAFDRRLLACLTAAMLVSCAPPAPEPAPAPAPAEPVVAAPDVFEPLEVLTDKGPVRFRVRIADDPAERERGLMFVSVLAEDEGMLFDFREAAPRAFWMKNTLIPLDIIFIGADGRILNIAENTRPYSLEPIPSTGPALGVLEIGGGLSAELGIEPGDKVAHRMFPR